MKTKEALKHTPRPWIYDGEFVRAKVQPINAHYPGDTVPQIVAHIEDCHEWEENARLIAAAPDLLAALQVILDEMAKWEIQGNMLDALRAMETARAAILRAEGK